METEVQVRAARLTDCERLAQMFAALWPSTTEGEHAREIRSILDGSAKLTMPITILVAEADDEVVVGFVEVDLRSHADGCDPAQPVGYVEGWYVAENFRRTGVGARLAAAAEDWACGFGCVEMGSDALIEKEVSQRAHAALGYEVVDRCVNFRKKL